MHDSSRLGIAVALGRTPLYLAPLPPAESKDVDK